MRHYRRQPILVDVQDWSQWPYVVQSGRPNVAQFWPRGYPTISQTNAYRHYGPPPRPKRVNHNLHILATILTVGFWLPVWFTVMIVIHTGNSRAEADYWFRIQQYYEWEQRQRGVIPAPRTNPYQGG